MSARSITAYTTLLFALLYLLPLGSRPIISPDEPRYGSIALEMLRNGDWWTMKLVGLYYYEKPPLGYWLTAASMSLFGEGAWGLRFPSAVAALVTAICTGAIARRVCDLPSVGLIATAVQLTMICPWVFGGIAILDGMFTAWTTLCVAFFVYGSTEDKLRRRVACLALCGVAAAGAFLTKGFLGIALPALITGGWLACQRRWRGLLLLPLLPVATSALAAAPVIFEIHRHNPGFWDYFFWIEHVRRFTAPDNNQHPEPWWYYLPLLPVGSLLWSLNFDKARKGWSASLFRFHGAGLCVSWIGLPLILLSASSGKLPSYIVPLFPALSILFAVSLLNYFSAPRGVSFLDQLGRCLLIAAALLSASFIATDHRWLLDTPLWLDHSSWRFGLISLALLAWAALDHWAYRASEPDKRLLRLALSPIPLLMIVGMLFPAARVEKSKVCVEALSAQSRTIALASARIVDSSLAPSLAFSTGKFDMLLVGLGGELDNELNLPHERERFIDRAQVMSRVAEARKAGTVALVISRDDWKAIQTPDSPKPLSQTIDGDLCVSLFEQER